MADRYTESGTPFLRSQDIEPFAIRTHSIKYVGDAFTKELRKSELREGDVVIVRTGYPGTAAVVPRGLSLANCADLVIISPGAGLDPWFLACLFNSAWGRSTVRGSLVGVAQQHFNVGAAREMRARVPPLDVQQRIGEIVKAYTDLIELNQRRIAILEEMARRLFEEWFVRFRYPGGEKVALVETSIGLTPSDWEIGRVSNWANVQRGRSYRGHELVDEGRPFVNLKCILRYGGFRRDGVKGFEGSVKPEHLLETGDIVIAVTDMTQERMIVAQAARIPPLAGRAVFSMDLVKLQPFDQTLRAFFYSLWRWSGCADRLRHHANGANVLHLGADRISSFEIAFPGEAIAKSFAAKVEPLFELADSIALASTRLRAARDLLLPKLISGEIDVSAAPGDAARDAA